VYPLVAGHTDIYEVGFAVCATLRAKFAMVDMLTASNTHIGLSLALVLTSLSHDGLHLAKLQLVFVGLC
jgi:hypothetical protein